MAEYVFHWSQGSEQRRSPSVRLSAESTRHGAALALRQFAHLGCDLATPLAHLDMTDNDGATHVLLVDEIVEWLKEPNQSAFVNREGLEVLFH